MHICLIFLQSGQSEKRKSEAATWMSHLEKKEEEKSSSRARGEERSPSLLTMVGFIFFDVRDFAFARSCGTRADFNQGQNRYFWHRCQLALSVFCCSQSLSGLIDVNSKEKSAKHSNIPSLYPPPPLFVDCQKVGLLGQEGGGDAQPLQTGSHGRQQKE